MRRQQSVTSPGGHRGDALGLVEGMGQDPQGVVIADHAGLALDRLGAEGVGAQRADAGPLEFLGRRTVFGELAQDSGHRGDRRAHPLRVGLQIHQHQALARSRFGGDGELVDQLLFLEHAAVDAAAAPVGQDATGHAERGPLPVRLARSGEDQLGVGLLDVAVLQAQPAPVVVGLDRRLGDDRDIRRAAAVARGRGAEARLHLGEGSGRVDVAHDHYGHVVRPVGRTPESQDVLAIPFEQVLVPSPDRVPVGTAVEGQLQAPAPGHPVAEGDVVVHVVLVHEDLAFGVQGGRFEARFEEHVGEDVDRRLQLPGRYGDVVVRRLVPGAGVGRAAGLGHLPREIPLGAAAGALEEHVFDSV